MIKESIAKIIDKKDLSRREMEQVMEEIMSGSATQSQIAAFLVALREKGETVEELTGAVIVMKKHAAKIRPKKKVILDTCGTGGDRKGTFNISTISAFVASGCGVTVAKHGNRSVSSLCGSADLLEALGIDLDMDSEKIQSCLNEIGIAFLFAQNLHPAMKYAAPVRKEIGVRTMFNLLGPLTNPAGATHQLVGVYSEDWTEPLARVLKNLGTKHGLVVHGKDGLDEITTTAATYVCEIKNGKIKNYLIDPRKFGLRRASPGDLSGGDVKLNVEILYRVLNGKVGAARDIVLLNAAAAIYAADLARNIDEGIKLARKSIDTGSALKKLELLRERSRKI